MTQPSKPEALTPDPQVNRGEGRTEARDLKTVALWICPECGRLGPIGAYEPRCIGPEHEGIGEDLPAMERIRYVPEKQRDEAEAALHELRELYAADSSWDQLIAARDEALARVEAKKHIEPITEAGIEDFQRRMDGLGIPRQSYEAQGGGMCDWTFWGRITELFEKATAGNRQPDGDSTPGRSSDEHRAPLAESVPESIQPKRCPTCGSDDPKVKLRGCQNLPFGRYLPDPFHSQSRETP